MAIGRVLEIWRYPVKSMGGGTLPRTELGALGIPGDRGWAIRDETAGEIRGAKKMPKLLRCKARYLAEPDGKTIPPAEVTFPDGLRSRTDSPEAAERLSSLVGRKVTLWPQQPAENRDHYRRAAPDDPDFEREMRQIFGRLDDEPLPDLSVFPSEIFEFTSPLGTYFDAFPLHLVSTAWLAELSRRNPQSDFDRRRFRPNLVIEPDGGVTGFPDLEWCGKRLRIGAATIEIGVPCVRCVMTTLPQGEIAADPKVLRTVVRESDQNVGVYATVVEPGAVAVGDPVTLE